MGNEKKQVGTISFCFLCCNRQILNEVALGLLAPQARGLHNPRGRGLLTPLSQDKYNLVCAPGVWRTEQSSLHQLRYYNGVVGAICNPQEKGWKTFLHRDWYGYNFRQQGLLFIAFALLEGRGMAGTSASNSLSNRCYRSYKVALEGCAIDILLSIYRVANSMRWDREPRVSPTLFFLKQEKSAQITSTQHHLIHQNLPAIKKPSMRIKRAILARLYD